MDTKISDSLDPSLRDTYNKVMGFTKQDQTASPTPEKNEPNHDPLPLNRPTKVATPIPQQPHHISAFDPPQHHTIIGQSIGAIEKEKPKKNHQYVLLLIGFILLCVIVGYGSFILINTQALSK